MKPTLLRVLLLFFASLPSSMWLFANPAIGAAPIKVMTFNVRFDAGEPSEKPDAWIALSGANRRERALRVVADFGPDLLGVQEALTNQIDELKKALSTHEFYGVGRADGVAKGEYCGIFYRKERFHCTREGTFWLNSDPDTPGTFFPKTCCARIASWVVLEDRQAAGRQYFVLNAHWDHEIQAARIFSAQLIRERVATLAGKRPMIVMGDFNATETNPAIVALFGTVSTDRLVLVDSFREVFPRPGKQERTFHGFGGGTQGERIDYILHNGDFRTERAAIVRTGDEGAFPSDHYPVTAVLVPLR